MGGHDAEIWSSVVFSVLLRITRKRKAKRPWKSGALTFVFNQLNRINNVTSPLSAAAHPTDLYITSTYTQSDIIIIINSSSFIYFPF